MGGGLPKDKLQRLLNLGIIFFFVFCSHDFNTSSILENC